MEYKAKKPRIPPETSLEGPLWLFPVDNKFQVRNTDGVDRIGRPAESNLHPVNTDTGAFHPAEPGHLTFGELVDCR